MPRGKLSFAHSVFWAPESLEQQRYHARIHNVKVIRGKVSIQWTIYTPIKRRKRRGKEV